MPGQSTPMPLPALPERVTSIIGGAPAQVTHSGRDLPVVNPANEEIISLLREADAQEVSDAVSAARDAFDRGPWPRMDINQRKDILYAIRDLLTEHAAELATLEVLNTGIPISHARGQVARMARNFEFFAEVASTLSGETYTQAKGYLTWVTREPKGVAGLISPWNAPLALSSMRIAACIAFGNTCVLKPSEYTPIAVARMVELLHESGLPAGVVNLVNGRGDVTGRALVDDPRVDMIAFTGGTETGRIIMQAAGSRLAPCILELGGKSANIIDRDADLERALDGALAGIFSNNGQQCLAGSRILVQEDIAAAFIEAFVERTGRLRLGDPLQEDTEIGPLAYKEHLHRVLSYVGIAKADGAKLLVGGTRAAGFDRGYYLAPTAVLAPSNRARVCQEEIFGPFATFLTFGTIEEAIAIANDSPYGLVGYVWSNNLDAVMKVAREVRTGTVWINSPMMRELRAPFGGYKQSGIGRDGARSSAEFFTELKTTTLPTDPPELPRLGTPPTGGKGTT